MEKIQKKVFVMPIIGFIFSNIFLILFFLTYKSWTKERFILGILPAIISIIGYLIISTISKHKLECMYKRKHYIIFFILLLFFVCLNITYYKHRNIIYKDICLNELKDSKIIYELNDSSTYYILFGTRNCIYCKQMDETYKEAFLKSDIHHIYYVDLSYEKIDNNIVQERQLTQLPLLVSYKCDEEQNRISGMVTVQKLLTFLKN